MKDFHSDIRIRRVNFVHNCTPSPQKKFHYFTVYLKKYTVEKGKVFRINDYFLFLLIVYYPYVVQGKYSNRLKNRKNDEYTRLKHGYFEKTYFLENNFCLPSVCLSVSLCVCACLSQHALIHEQIGIETWNLVYSYFA